MTETITPNWNDLEVDKVPGAWVLTWWLPDGSATLRLKVRRTSSIEPEDFIAEIKFRDTEEFQKVHEFCEAVYAIQNPHEFDDVWEDLPNVWTEEFKAMTEVWGRLVDIAEFGTSVQERYAGEPHHSFDYFLSGKKTTA